MAWPHAEKGYNKHASGAKHKYGTRQRLYEDRQVQAKVRQLIASKRSVKDRLTELDARLGKGIGAVRERARLAKG